MLYVSLSRLTLPNTIVSLERLTYFDNTIVSLERLTYFDNAIVSLERLTYFSLASKRLLLKNF